MHGIGNDYVYINCFEEEMKDPVKLAPIISDRHCGVGSDGLILILPSKAADCKDAYLQCRRQRGADVRKRYPLCCKICV